MNLKLMGLLVAGAALALAGCGGGTGSVSGVVKHKGQPLKGGTISFYGRSSGVWSSEIKSDGTYAVSGVPTGTAKVAVSVPVAISMPGLPAPKVTPIAAKYNDPEQSGLTCEVHTGSQTKDFDVD